MRGHTVTMLGTGLIGDFYTRTLHRQRAIDRVAVVHSRSEERGRDFSKRWAIPDYTTSMDDAIKHPETDVVIVGLPNHLHEEAIELTAAAGHRRAGEAGRRHQLSAGCRLAPADQLQHRPGRTEIRASPR